MTVQARRQESAEERVTPLELFFDLIFVFAITQVTGLIVADPTWAGLVKGLLVLGVLWWAWAAYAWLTNTINPEEGAVRIAMFAAMGAMLIASLAVPDVFGDDALLFACAYAFVRIAHLVLYAIAGRGDRDLLAAVARLGAGRRSAWGSCSWPRASTAASRSPSGRSRSRSTCSAPYVGGGRGWHLSAGHFVERHALIVIIALGETIVALGVGASHNLDPGVVAAGLLGFVIAAAMWWLYFDVVAIVAERKLRETTGNAQLRDGPRLVQLPAPADGRRDHPLRGRRQEDARRRRRAARSSCPPSRSAAGSRSTSLAHILFRLRNVALAEQAAPRRLRVPARADPARSRARRPGHARRSSPRSASALIAYEAIRFADARDRVRHAAAEPAG